MPEEKIIWTHKKAVEAYHKEISKKSSGVVDEKYVKNFITSKGKVKVVSLGIGTGKKLNWLDKINNIKEIIGVDYSSDSLDICEKVAKKCKVKVILIKENLFFLKKFKKIIREEKSLIIYICLINTLGNFSSRQQERILKNIKNLMKEKDRLILCLYKRPEEIKARIFLPPQIKIKGSLDKRVKMGALIEYGCLELIWLPILEKYHRLPRFWYNEKTDDVTIYVGEEKILISHRFSKDEIKKLCKVAKLKIEKIIEGKFMWVVILKI